MDREYPIMSEDNRHSRWASATSSESLERAMRDQATIARRRLNDGDTHTGYTQAHFSRRYYDVVRCHRDDLDYREWNASTGFSGVNRWPTRPGLETESQARRRRRRAELDDGF